MTEVLLKCNQAILMDSNNAISSQELEDWHTHCNSQEYRQTAPFGQQACPVSPSVSQGKALEKQTSAIYSSILSILSDSAGQKLHTESKCSQQLNTDGSMTYATKLVLKVTPSGRTYAQLRARAHRVSDSGFTGLPTPTAADATAGERPPDKKRGTAPGLIAAAQMMGWPAARATDGGKNVRALEGALKETVRKGCPQDLCSGALMAGWATPNTMDVLPTRSPHQAMYNQSRNGGRTGRDFSGQFTGTSGRNDAADIPRCENGCGEWDNPDWIYCRDNKYRPIKSGSIEMVTRVSGGMVCCCNFSSQTNEPEKESEVIYGDASETDTTKTLPALQFKAGTETDKWTTGRFDGFQEKKALQSGLYGARSDKGSSDERESQPLKSNQKHQTVMRGVWKNNYVTCPSCGREPFGQLEREFDDVVRCMPQASTLETFFCADGTSYMLALRQASNEAKPLLDSQYPLSEVWESISEEDKERVRVHFNSRAWLMADPLKLLVGKSVSNSSEPINADETQEARVMRLKGYGNAIVPQVAAQFISDMETICAKP